MFTDVKMVANYQSMLNKKMDEDRKERLLEMKQQEFVKNYYTEFYHQCELVFKMVVSKNVKKHPLFFKQVKQIKEKGVQFFEKVLDLDIPDTFNVLIIAQLVMYWEECLQSKVKVELFNKKWTISISNPDCLIKDNNDEEDETIYDFFQLWFCLGDNIGFHYRVEHIDKGFNKDYLMNNLEDVCSYEFKWRQRNFDNYGDVCELFLN
jgi:hypothetical protein